MTGVSIELFWEVEKDIEPRFVEGEEKRLERSNRQRAMGGGREPELSAQNQLLLTMVWLRCYPKQNVLGYLFGVSASSVSRVVNRVLPLLEASGRDTMRLPDPGRKRHKTLDALLSETPELAVVIDTFEQRVQRPKERKQADAHFSGKKRCHTLKSQVAVNEETGLFVDVAESVRGPTADLKVLAASGLLKRLPQGVGAIGDLAYVGIAALHPQKAGASPRRKPPGKPRPDADQAFNQAFARRRIVVEHSLRLVRCFEATNHTDRHHRRHHTRRIVAVAGLVNRRLAIRHRLVNFA